MMDLRTLLVIVHVIGAVIGAGAATVGDYLFFKFSRDKRVDKDELRIIKTVSELVWVGLLILLLSGFGFLLLYISDYNSIRDHYNFGKIAAKATIVAVLIGNGLVLHHIVLPIFAARVGKPLATTGFIKKSPIIFTAGAVSFVSWYATIILGAWRGLQLGYWAVMLSYVGVLLTAVVISNMAGRLLLKHLRKRD